MNGSEYSATDVASAPEPEAPSVLPSGGLEEGGAEGRGAGEGKGKGSSETVGFA